MGSQHTRLATRALAALALTLALAVPAAAQAATFLSEYPAAPVHMQPTMLAVDAFSRVALDERSPQITVDGVAYKTFLLNVGSVSGGWTASEVWDAAHTAWVIRWTWAPSVTDATKATLYTYPVFASPLADGSHDVTASVKDVTGATFTDHWTFTVGIAPSLGAPTPAPNSRVSTTTPAISVPVTDNTAGALGATATVNGSPVTSSVSGGSARLASTALPNDATATVTVTVTDAAGNRSSKTWSFFVEIYPEMFSTIGQCASCHPDAAKSRDMLSDCSLCHAGQQDRPHVGAPVTFHAKADVATCSPCHVSDITVEHARHLTKAGGPITCLTCHTSADSKVVSAIAAGDTRCTACHTGTSGHESLHTTTVTPTCAGSGCHVATSLTGLHINSGTSLTCDTCHKSADPKVVSAIASHDKSCTACHDSSGHTAAHDTTVVPACAGSGCHTGTNLTTLHINSGTSLTCDTCHKSGDPKVVSAIAGHDKSCTACHDASSPHSNLAPAHRATFGAVNLSILGTSYGSFSCSECHQSAELYDLHDGCSTCHPSPRDTATPWNKSCVTGGCHASGGSAPQHAKLDSAHVTGSHSCIVDGCHTGGGSLAAIHAKEGCGVCHASGVTPSGDCTTCHDTENPHGDVNSIHESAGEGTMLFLEGGSNHAGDQLNGNDVLVDTDCTMCHSSNLIPQHQYVCSTCHAPGGPRDSVGTWDKTCSTGDCHPSFHDDISSAHDGQYDANNCGECHDSIGYGEWDGNSSREWCGTCHGRPNDDDAPVTTSDAVDLYSGQSAVINLTATDNGWVRDTYYQVDGGEIQIGSTVNVALAGEHTLRFWSIDGAGHVEDPNNVTFTLIGGDNTPPTTASDAKATYQYTATVNLSASDPGGSGVKATHYILDGAPAVVGVTVATNVTGPHTLEFWSEDRAGNVEQPHKTVAFTVLPDTTPPTTTSNAVASYAGVATIGFTANDTGGSGVANVYSNLDGAGAVAGGTVKVYSGGSHTLKFWAVDYAGNVETSHTVTFTVTADTIPPVTSATIPPVFKSWNVNIHLIASDTGGSGLAHTYYKTDNNGPSEGTWAFFNGDGPHVLTYWSVDGAGNVETSHTLSFILDSIAPTTSLLDAQASYTGTATIHMSASDGALGSGVKATYWRDGGLAQQTGTTAVISPPSSGTVHHTLYYWSEDLAGNIEGLKSVGLDVTAP